jgi:uncharacterized protein YciI
VFLIILTYKKTLEEVDKLLDAHRAFLAACYDQNRLICSGPQAPRVGGVMLSQLIMRDDVQAMIQQDPFWQTGVAEYEVIEFEPRMKHPQFQF